MSSVCHFLPFSYLCTLCFSMNISFLKMYLLLRFVQQCLVLKYFQIEIISFDSIGPNPIREFRMVERHYFREKLLKSFDFDFGFCIPDSKNACEQVPLKSFIYSNIVFLKCQPNSALHGIASVTKSWEMIKRLNFKTSKLPFVWRSKLFIVVFGLG